MKKTILIVFAVMAGTLAFAQAGFKIGARLMPQSTWLFNKDDSNEGPELNYKSTFGFAGGISVGYGFNDYLGAEMDFIYSAQGQKYLGKINDAATGTTLANITAQTKLGYLKIPLLFKVNTSPEAAAMFSAFIGPQISILMGAKDTYEETWSNGSFIKQEIKNTSGSLTFTGQTSPENYKLDKKLYKSTNFGIVFGLGTDFRLSDNLVLNSNVRLDYGFGDAEDKSASVTTWNGAPQNPPDKWWEGTDSKWTASSDPNRVRAKTNLVTGGIQIGITYTFVQ